MMDLGSVSSFGSATKGLSSPIRQDGSGASVINTGGLGRKDLFLDDGSYNDSM